MEEIVESDSKFTFTFKEKSLGKFMLNFLKSKAPSDVILVDTGSGEDISCGHFIDCTLKLAKILLNFGIKGGDVVAIVSVNSWKYLVAIFSAAYVGATVCNINPIYLKDELHHALSISKPKIIFTIQPALEKLRLVTNELTFVERILLLDIPLEDLLADCQDYQEFQIQDEDRNENVRFILYSSGTTGLPKGVMLTERNMKAALTCYMDPLHNKIDEKTVILQFLPLFHIYGLVMSLTHLLSFQQKVIIMDRFVPEVFLKNIEQYRVTKVPLVAQVLSFLTTSPLVQKYDVSSLKDIFCGGSGVGKEIEELASKRFKNAIIRQGYGLTEATAIVAATPNGESKLGSCGKLVIGVSVKIVNPENGKTVAPTETGEICVRGPAVMKGYKDNELETRNAIDRDGWLHTGDVGHFDDEGFLYVIDRLKELIKYKGFQVAPAELEEVILKHPKVKEVTVVGKPDERRGELPIAFVVKNPMTEVTEQEIIDIVAEKLSTDKQLHGGVIFIETLPRNSNGKILRRVLREMLQKTS